MKRHAPIYMGRLFVDQESADKWSVRTLRKLQSSYPELTFTTEQTLTGRYGNPKLIHKVVKETDNA